MRFFKKLLIAIALMVVLVIVRPLLLKLYPGGREFITILITAIQMLLLSWAIFTGLLESIAWKKRSPRKAFVNSLLVFIAVIALAECSCLLLLRYPEAIPGPLLKSFDLYYNTYDREILQFNKKITRYDSALFYRMKSNNRSLFTTSLFSDSVFTNSQGFRNRELAAGEVTTVCLGDSHTLGWGVKQEEAFPQQLEGILQTAVLNTGMASYGTAREIESIRSLGLHNMQQVVIQFCNNDIQENEAYVKNNYRLTISPRTTYDNVCDAYHWNTRYFPGKCFTTVTKLFLREKLTSQSARANDIVPGEQVAHTFIDIVKHAGWDFDRIQVIVFNINEAGDSIGFIPALEKQLSLPENKAVFKDRVQVLHVAQLLTASDFYLLDWHPKAAGHRKIAVAIADMIKNNRPVQ